MKTNINRHQRFKCNINKKNTPTGDENKTNVITITDPNEINKKNTPTGDENTYFDTTR